MKFFGSKFTARGSQRDIAAHLDRIATCLEMICSEQFGMNVRPPKADKSGPEPEMIYTNEEMDVLREIREEIEARQGRRAVEEEESV